MLAWAARLVGAWALGNGALHNMAVLGQDHEYDREFLYLLMIGAILFFCGLLNIIVSWGLRQNRLLALNVGAVATLFVIALCVALIPVFPATGMMVVHLALLAMLAAGYLLRIKAGK